MPFFSQPPLSPSSARGPSRRVTNADSGAIPLSARAITPRRQSSYSTPRSQRGRDGGSVNSTPTRSRTESAFTPRRGSLASDMYNTLQTQGNAMKVYVRVRPYSEREMGMKTSTHSTVRIDSANPSLITLLDPNRGFRPNSTYSFTRCFWSVLERAEDAAENERALGIQESIDTYMNSASRARSQSLPTMLSARSRGGGAGAGREKESAREDGALSYVGSGSSATMSAANVSHPPYANQEMVYVNVGKPVLENMLDGYNGCVFAYGQTGSGKTFTMLGYAPAVADMRGLRSRRESAVAPPSESSLSARVQSPRSDAYSTQASPVDSDEGPDVVDKTALDPNELQGIIPRITADMFEGLRAKRQKDPSLSYRVEVSYYEVYNEKVYDLVRPQRNGDLKIRHNPVAGPYVEGLANKVVMKEEEVMKILRKGMQERHTAATKFNDRSSRSHAILTFSILQLYLDENDSTCKMHSKLNLVDLAGSERTGAAGAEGHEMADGIKINLSLTVLGRVIDCLADLSQSKSLAVPVPYRDSNLTWLLSDSLGGNSQTSMVATISPHMVNYEEMRQTIRYASRAKQIVNRAVRNEDPQVVQIRELRNEVSRLQQLLREAGGHEFTREYVLELERKCRELEKRCTEQEVTIGNLRAKLENAGISPSSTVDDAAGGSLRGKKTAVEEEVKLRKQLDAAQADLATARASFEQKADELSRELNSVKGRASSLMDENGKLEMGLLMGMQWWGVAYPKLSVERLAAVMRLVEEKEKLLLDSVSRSVSNSSMDLQSAMDELRREHAEELKSLQLKYEVELESLSKRNEAQLKDALDDATAQQQLLVNRHCEAIKAMEEKMVANRQLWESEGARVEREKEELRGIYENNVVKVREQYQQELERLRSRFQNGISDRQRTGDSLRQVQDAYDREVQRLKEEIERVKRAKETEVSRLQSQLENEGLRRESELLEKDRQRRLVENDLSVARREIMKLGSVKNKMEKDYQEQISDLMLQQEKLMSVSNTVLSDWENKSASMEADMCNLRALIYDKDYMNFRQRIRENAFAQRASYDKELLEVDEKQKREAEKIHEIVTMARRAQEAQNKSIQRFEEEIQNRKLRSAQLGSKSTSFSSIPPPHMLTLPLSRTVSSSNSEQ